MLMGKSKRSDKTCLQCHSFYGLLCAVQSWHLNHIKYDRPRNCLCACVNKLSPLLATYSTTVAMHLHSPAGQEFNFFNTNTHTSELKFGWQPCRARWFKIPSFQTIKFTGYYVLLKVYLCCNWTS